MFYRMTNISFLFFYLLQYVIGCKKGCHHRVTLVSSIDWLLKSNRRITHIRAYPTQNKHILNSQVFNTFPFLSMCAHQHNFLLIIRALVVCLKSMFFFLIFYSIHMISANIYCANNESNHIFKYRVIMWYKYIFQSSIHYRIHNHFE